MVWLRSRFSRARTQPRRSNFKRTFKKRSFSSVFRKGTKKVFSAKKKKGFVSKKQVIKKALRFKRGNNAQQKRLQTAAAGVNDNVLVYNYVDTVTSVGTTNAAAVQKMWAVNQVTGNAGSVASNFRNMGLMDNRILAMVLGQTSAPGGDGAVTTQAIIKSYETSMEVRNITTGPITFWEYRCVARHDLQDTGSASGVALLVTDGFADATARAAGDNVFTSPLTSTTLGATLYMNPRFTSQCKIKKVKKFTINPGRSKRFKYVTRKMRLVKNETFNIGTAPDPDGSSASFRGVSKGQSFSVFCMCGTYASNEGANAGFKEGFGNADVGITAQIKVHYAKIAQINMTTAATTAAAGFSAGAASYPAPLMLVQPVTAISTGPVPAAAGTVVRAGTNDVTMVDDIMQGP